MDRLFTGGGNRALKIFQIYILNRSLKPVGNAAKLSKWSHSEQQKRNLATEIVQNFATFRDKERKLATAAVGVHT
jgi:hypothetical protein